MKRLLFLILFFTLSFSQTKIWQLAAIESLRNNDLFFITQDNTDLTPGDYKSKKLTFKVFLAQLKDSVFTKLDSATYVRTFSNQDVDGIKTFKQNIITALTKGIQSANYQSNLVNGVGYAIKQDPISGMTFEIDNIIVRGSLYAKEFLLNQTKISGGDLIVAEGAKISKIVADQAANITIGGVPITIDGDAISTTAFDKRAIVTLIDPYGNEITPFQKYDLIEIQKYYPNKRQIIARIRGEVVRVRGNQVEFNYYTGGVTVGSTTLTVGDVIVQKGNTRDVARQGSIGMHINAYGTPYIAIRDGVNSFTNSDNISTLKGIYGNLLSVKDNIQAVFPSSNPTYGLYLPDGTFYAVNGYLSGKLVVGSGDVDSLLQIKADTSNLGALAYLDEVEKSKLGTTIIEGGYFKNDLIQTKSLIVDNTTLGAKLATDSTAIAGLTTTKTQTFFQTTAPTAAAVGDIWFDSDALNAIYRWNGSAWIAQIGAGTGIGTYINGSGIYTSSINASQMNAGTIDAARINTPSLSIAGTTLGAKLTADSTAITTKARTFIQTSAPTATATGDIWIDSDALNAQYRWSGSAWVAIIGAGTGIGTYINSSGIYTSTINASQVNAGKILSAVISADSIKTGKLRSNIISADSIKTGTLTGLTIQSSSGNDRVVLSSGDQINGYKNNNAAFTIKSMATAGITPDYGMSLDITFFWSIDAPITGWVGNIVQTGWHEASSYISSGSYINANSGFKTNGVAGLSATKTFTDNDGKSHSVVISGGIITSWTITP